MNYKGLMVGDWVICNHYQDKPFTKQFVVADFAKGEYEFCEPIPLTDDILMKNGFRYSISHDDWTNADCNFFLYKSYNSYRILNTDIKLNYVHELQHMLRLCGIEKEIVID